MTTLYYTTRPAATATHLPRAARSFSPHADLTLARTPAGKPYFPAAPDLHVSVSHSDEVWLCACADAPVGVDIQRCSARAPEKSLALARRFFHPDEVAHLAAHPQDFYAVWCAKEACVKLWGSGIAADFPRFSVIADGALVSPIPGTRMHLAAQAGYLLALICADGAYTAQSL